MNEFGNHDDPRQPFIPGPFFDALWAIEIKHNEYRNQLLIPLQVPPDMHDEERKLFLKHFPGAREPEKLGRWGRAVARLKRYYDRHWRRY